MTTKTNTTTNEGEPRCYRIIRSWDARFNRKNRTVKSSLTLAEAQAHCANPATSVKGEWFDGYEYMKGCAPKAPAPGTYHCIHCNGLALVSGNHKRDNWVKCQECNDGRGMNGFYAYRSTQINGKFVAERCNAPAFHARDHAAALVFARSLWGMTADVQPA